MATLVHLAEQIQAPNHTGLMTYETWRVLGVFNMVSSLLPIMTSKDISLTVQGCNMDRRWQAKKKRVWDKGEVFTGHHNVGPSRPRARLPVFCSEACCHTCMGTHTSSSSKPVS